MSEASLGDLYTWNGRCLQQAWQLTVTQGAAPMITLAELDLAAGAEPVATTERLFASLGRLSGNEPCAETIAALNERLHVARTLETRLFADAAREWTALTDCLRPGSTASFQSALAAYHRRRLRAAPQLIRLLHRPGALG
jgi:hypothetical protein